MSSRSKVKKKKVSVSIRLHPEILNVVDRCAEKLGVTRTDVIGVAIRAIFGATKETAKVKAK